MMGNYTGTHGRFYVKPEAASEWQDLGPVAEITAEPVVHTYTAPDLWGKPPPSYRVRCRLKCAPGAWNQMMRVLGRPEWIIHPNRPYRRRKHGGQWQSKRDVRTNWRPNVRWGYSFSARSVL